MVRTLGSVPRAPRATLPVAPDGTAARPVSGGGEEAAYEAAEEVPVLRHYDAGDEFAPGHTGGGSRTVLSNGPDGQRQEAGMEIFASSLAAPPRIAAEIIARRCGGAGCPLAQTTGPIHQDI